MRTQQWARELYDRLRAEGKSYGRALRAISDQLLEMLYAILVKRTPYSQAYHLQMKALLYQLLYSLAERQAMDGRGAAETVLGEAGPYSGEGEGDTASRIG